MKLINCKHVVVIPSIKRFDCPVLFVGDYLSDDVSHTLSTHFGHSHPRILWRGKDSHSNVPAL